MSSARPDSDRGALRADLVFEGGGVKGIALAGAYRELTARGYVPQCVAGTSAGAITAALVAVGYSGPEVEEIVLREMHFPDFADPTFLSRFGHTGEMAEWVLRRGMHSGEFFMGWLREHLAAKQKTTFGDLRDPNARAENRRYRLQVIASDLTDHSMLILPRDAAKLGIDDPDQLEIVEAVRMSMSIPVFFDPVVFPNKRTGEDHVVVDGGLLSNYPIWLFDAPDGSIPEFPTFGMTFDASGAESVAHASGGRFRRDVRSDIEFLKSILETMLEAHDRRAMDDGSHARTIRLPTLGIGGTDFDISPERAKALFDAGRTATAEFLEHWNFDAYLKKYASAGADERRAS